MSAAPTILLDETAGAHVYSVGGVVMPNVTTILQNCGLIDCSAVPEHMLEWGRERGSAVHKAAHYMLADDLDYESLDQILGEHVGGGRIEGGYLGSLQRYLEATRMQMDKSSLEERLYCPIHQYCGTQDGVGLLPDSVMAPLGCPPSRQIVVDWKSGIMEGVRYQLAAYAMAHKPAITWRLALKLNRTGKAKAFLFGPETLMHDYGVFLAALNIEKEKRRIRR